MTPDEREPAFRTLVSLLRTRAAESPDDVVFTFLDDAGAGATELTYAALDRRARAVAVMLQAAGLAGERVLLLYPPGVDYVVAFFGCVYAGAIAAPAFPPDPARLSRTLPRLKVLADDARAAAALATEDICALARTLLPEAGGLTSLRWIATDGARDGADAWRDPGVTPESLAFLQYTSGSTSTPKGVMLSHQNLLHNSELIRRGFGTTSKDIVLSWLPPYHDMGLIGCILQPIYVGGSCVLMSPISFLQRPSRWLKAMGRYRATISGGPNFAYEMCIRKVSPDERVDLDLSSWRVAFSGAEPVRPDTLERFAESFRPNGFRAEAYVPCYGLAEATLAVSATRTKAGANVRAFGREALAAGRVEEVAPNAHDAHLLVGCGEPARDQELLIVEPESRIPVPEGRTGEIWVRGPSVAGGYWQQPEHTEATFRARRADTGEGPFLRTGDIGFLADGEVFIAGRLKDLIVLRGKNVYPQDIEHAVEGVHPAVRRGCAAAFSVPGERAERLVVAVEVDPRQTFAPAEVVDAIRQEIAEHHGQRVGVVLLLAPGGLPKTSSGKVQRNACRQDYLDQSLDLVHEWSAIREGTPWMRGALTEYPPAQRENVEALGAWLSRRVAKRFGISVDEIGLDQPITRYGMDSLQSVELQHEIESRLGVRVGVANLLRGVTIRELATVLAHAPALRNASQAPPPGPGFAPTAQALSPEQLRLFALERSQPGESARHVALMVRLSGALDIDALSRALVEVVRQHDSLRTTFSDEGPRPERVVSAETHVRVEVSLLSHLPAKDRADDVAAAVQRDVRAPYDLKKGPLFRARILRLAGDEHLLLLAAHHIVADLWSLGLVLRDVSLLYPAFAAGAPPSLPALAATYGDAVRAMRHRFTTPAFAQHIAWWRTHLKGVVAPLLPTDRPRPERPSPRGDDLLFSLPATLVTRLEEVGRANQATLFMTLLAAMKALVCRVAGQTDVVIATPCLGRTEVASRDLVGFFAYPLLLRTDLSGDPRFVDALRRVRDEALAVYDHQDVPFSAVAANVAPSGGAIATVMFSVLTQPLMPETIGPATVDMADVGNGGTDFDLFLTLVPVADGLRACVGYRTELFDRPTIERFIAGYRAVLDQIVASTSVRISELELPTTPKEEPPYVIDVAATFTADPLADVLRFWSDELGLGAQVELAPFDHVLPRLLDRDHVAAHKRGARLTVVRLEDWFPNGDEATLDGRIKELSTALRAAAAVSRVPHIVLVGPPSRAALADPRRAGALARAEDRLVADAADIPGVHVLRPEDVLTPYPVAEVDDVHALAIARIPYTEAAYAAIGTALARRLRAIVAPPCKVVVVDCDGTLWGGVCAEEGAAGVRIDGPRQELQRALVALKDAGVLVCLASKNAESDVWAVFDGRPDMLLHRDHLAGWRIGWQPKSQSLRELAREMGVALDSFVFLDDSPVECAEVRAECPSVLTVAIPDDPARLPQLLRQLWAFDRLTTTDEDRQRTLFVQQNRARRELEAHTPSFADFLAGLELSMTITPAEPADIVRVSQLTRRTNQLNFSTIRRDEAEVRALLAKPGNTALVVKVRDRFGDYGLVGVILLARDDQALVVDTFLLSCRVLGRGVEHRMLAEIGRRAVELGSSTVVVVFQPTPRNAVAGQLLASVAEPFARPGRDATTYVIPAAECAAIELRPAHARPTVVDEERATQPRLEAVPRSHDAMLRIATDLADARAIAVAVRARFPRRAKVASTSPFVAPRDQNEATIARAFSEVLGVANVSVTTSFFELGGDSLLGAQVLARVRRDLGVEVTFDHLLDGPGSVAHLAEIAGQLRISAAGTDAVAAALGEIENLSDEQIAALLDEGGEAP